MPSTANGHLDCLQALCSKSPNHLNSKDEDGLTPLSWAVINEHEFIVQGIVEQEGVDVASQDREKRTAMSHAAELGKKPIINSLHRCGRRLVSMTDENGLTPLFWAAENGYFDTVSLFIEGLNCQLDSTNTMSGRTLIAHVAKVGHVDVAKYLLDSEKVDPFAKDYDEETALTLAVDSGNKDMVEFLSHCPNPRKAGSIYGHALLLAMNPKLQ
ncbi:ankyrin repeat-containing domain protein [Aspergillus cavernicola]|uniref:Ankyrin repeat-containing domain protein n=1 Tax=Aspergillus cavernicola TaxID=176166 RepID=A0ABR4HQD1_9EURO